MRTFYSRFQQAAEHWPQAVALEMQRRDGLAQVRYGELARMAAAIGGCCGSPAMVPAPASPFSPPIVHAG